VDIDVDVDRRHFHPVATAVRRNVDDLRCGKSATLMGSIFEELAKEAKRALAKVATEME